MTKFAAPIAEQIWNMKYRFKDHVGTIDETIHDATVEDTWARIARALAVPELERGAAMDDFFEALEDFQFLPAGRIIAGAGTGRMVTLFNCYVMGTIEDSMRGIFEHLKEAALTMQQGGGIGYDFSTIRPKTALVKKLGSDASGPLSFMDVWDKMCMTVMSAGSRRGAMMATMRCDHPDIEDFITAKQDATRLRKFNLSVLVTDAFMAAVRADGEWDLVHAEPPANFGQVDASVETGDLFVHKTVRARDLWNLILKSTYAAAEPGVIFIDRINQTNNLREIETIAATNPCGEQPLPPYGACLLGSINLAKLIDHAFEKNAGLDLHRLRPLVQTAIRMMDNVIEVSNFPLPAQKEEAFNKRRLGLGVTGLADALAMVGLRYGSPEAVARTESWMRLIDEEAYRASALLAKEKGAFPLFDADQFLAEGTHASTLTDKTQSLIRQHGIRNSHLTSIAPTGTISLYAGNISSGIEPIFSTSYTRKVLQNDGSHTEEVVEDYAVARYREWWLANEADTALEDFDPDLHLPDYFVTADDLKPEEHVAMQAAAQKWVDSSISKTINLPEAISFEDFAAVYDLAYDSGCKGCTTYRPNDITGSVLTAAPKKEKPEEPPVEVEPNAHEWEPEAAKEFYHLPERPEALPGTTYKITVGANKAVYLTVSDITEDGVTRPFEVFIRSSDPTHDEWMTALARMVSAIMRRPFPADFVAEELRQITSNSTGGYWGKRGYQPSLVAAIGTKLREHMAGPVASATFEAGEAAVYEAMAPARGQPCPACNSYNTKLESGCLTCLDCGHSKCG